ncbi:MAG: helicase-related protein [Clostridium sp.]
MITITLINCNQGLLDGPRKILNKLYNEFEIKHPNAFQIMLHQRGRNSWDGKVHFLTETGKFKIGLLPTIYNRLVELKQKVKVVDKRPPLSVVPSIPKVVGDKTLRPEQRSSLADILNNKVGGIPFYIGVGDLAVNFGKSLLFAAIYMAFKKKLKVLLLTNDSDWLSQSKSEFPELIPREELTFVQGSKVTNWNQFSIGMVQSISRNIRTYQRELSQIDIVLIDEADIIDNKTYKTVIEHLYNTRIRIGLSGTIYMSNLKKDLLHNMNIRSFIGDKLTEVKLHQMIKKGYSTPVVVKMVPGNGQKGVYKDYPTEYEKTITLNRKSYKLSLKRTLMNVGYGRIPALVVTKYIMHCEELYKFYKKHLKSKYTIRYVHHETKDRDNIMKLFREGKIDILISTTIISRGKNFPLLRYLQNCGSMDSNEKTIQLLGRLVRTHESKSKAYLDDIMYQGKYLSRHSNHRKNFYKKEKMKVIDLGRKRKKR